MDTPLALKDFVAATDLLVAGRRSRTCEAGSAPRADVLVTCTPP